SRPGRPGTGNEPGVPRRSAGLDQFGVAPDPDLAHRQAAEAWQVETEGRDMEARVQPAAHPVGTSVEVRDLFFNTPARRKFLRSEKTEFDHLQEVIKRLALARFDVGFHLRHNGKAVLALHAAGEDAARA